MGLLEVSGESRLIKACIVPDLNDGDSKYILCTNRQFTFKGKYFDQARLFKFMVLTGNSSYFNEVAEL